MLDIMWQLDIEHVYSIFHSSIPSASFPVVDGCCGRGDNFILVTLWAMDRKQVGPGDDDGASDPLEGGAGRCVSLI